MKMRLGGSPLASARSPLFITVTASCLWFKKKTSTLCSIWDFANEMVVYSYKIVLHYLIGDRFFNCGKCTIVIFEILLKEVFLPTVLHWWIHEWFIHSRMHCISWALSGTRSHGHQEYHALNCHSWTKKGWPIETQITNLSKRLLGNQISRQ